jgi:ribosomal protein S18 acetylase RimI-like enzyme
MLERATVSGLRKELSQLGCEVAFLKTEVLPRALMAEGMEKHGLELADVKLEFARDASADGVEGARALSAEFRIAEDLESLEFARKTLYAIADRSRFMSYFGQEKARGLYDRWFENLRSDRAAVRWAVVSHLPSRACAGLIASRISEENPRKVAHWEFVGVSEDFRGQGVGKAMADHLLRAHANEGVGRIRVGTQIDNLDAAVFYQAIGFRLVKTFYQFHLHPLRDRE